MLEEKSKIEEILKKCSEHFLLLLTFFYYDKEEHQIKYVEHKIDHLIKHKQFKQFFKDINQTHIKEYIYNLNTLLKFQSLKRFLYKRIWYYNVFLHLHKIARELKLMTTMLDSYIIDYKDSERNGKEKLLPYLKQASELFSNRYEELVLSKTAVRKKEFKKHPCSDYNYLLNKFQEPSTWVVLAMKDEKVIGFGMISKLNLVHTWENIVEAGELIVDPAFRGFGIAENLNLIGDYYLRNNLNFDYSVALSTTFHPITIHLIEKLDYRPFIIELAGFEDYYGYAEPGFGNCDFTNYIFFAKDFRRDIKNSRFIVFSYKEHYWSLRMIYFILGCYRNIVIVKDDAAIEVHKDILIKLKEEIENIKKQGFGGYFVDITEQEAAGIMKLLHENGFYMCGVLPVAQKDGEVKRDYAYYRYLDENKTTYPYIFLNYKGVSTRFRYRMWHLKLKTISYFNKTRKKNKIPKVEWFYRTMRIFQNQKKIGDEFENL